MFFKFLFLFGTLDADIAENKFFFLKFNVVFNDDNKNRKLSELSSKKY